MKLKTLIKVRLSTSENPDKITIHWKTEEELLSWITLLIQSFNDSDEPMNDPKVILNYILSLKDKIKSYQSNKDVIEKDLEFLDKCTKSAMKKDGMGQEEFKDIIDVVTKKIEREREKNGDPYIELTKDELYDILSLQAHREKQLNKIQYGRNS